MKQPKKPTRDQKEIMMRNDLNPNEWMVLLEGRSAFTVIHKKTKEKRTLEK